MPPDHAGIELGGGNGLTPHSHQFVGRNRNGLTFGHHGLHRLDLHSLSCQPVGGLTDQYLACRCRLLQARGRVYRVTGHKALPRGGIARDHLSRVHPCSVRQSNAPARFELAVQLPELLLHLRRRSQGPEGVVLVGSGEAEDSHHRVPDVLLNGPTVALEAGAHLFEVAIQNLTERLRVKALSEGRGPYEVGEDDGDGPAFPFGRHRDERGGATHAEPGALGVLLPTVRTGGHGRESKFPRSPGTRVAGEGFHHLGARGRDITRPILLRVANTSLRLRARGRPDQ